MAITQRLEFRQSQSLVMTAQLQQAIKLLQLSNLELSTFVEGELEQNPLLERDEGDDASPALEADAQAPEGPSDTPSGDSPSGDPPPDDAQAGDEPEAPPDTLDLANSDDLPNGNEAPLDTDFANVFDGDMPEDRARSGQESAQRGGSFDELDSRLEQRISGQLTLREHLAEQLQMDLSDPVERMIGIHLIDMLDEAGYLVGGLASVAEVLGCDEARVEATLKKMQGFDPTGIFARDLGECLALQLAEVDRLDPAMVALLDNLDLLARRDLTQLLRICGVDPEDLTEMISEIRALNPKPAMTFDQPLAEAVVPDIIMRAHSGGGWLLELNSETLPRLLVNNNYYARVAKQARKKAERAYLVERLQSANWLVKALHQRATTILKVATEIVGQQDGFFRKGVAHLRPLTLRDVAEQVSVHESTVSRVTANKFMATPRGTYELKYFFTSAIPATGQGASHSAEAVRHRIRQLIDTEAPKSILSDDGIVTALRSDGIEIARRTVAKYREAMRIPSSVQRRREKALEF